MIPVLSATTGECVVCGEVASERDLLWIETQDEADKHNAEVDDLICRECAGVGWECVSCGEIVREQANLWKIQTVDEARDFAADIGDPLCCDCAGG